MLAIVQHEAARRDLIQHFVYLAENAGLEVADRFLGNAKTSFEPVAKQPLIGSPLPVKNPALAGTRKWRVKGIDKYLVFYLPEPGSIHIIRVLHSSSDWWQTMSMEP